MDEVKKEEMKQYTIKFLDRSEKLARQYADIVCEGDQDKIVFVIDLACSFLITMSMRFFKKNVTEESYIRLVEEILNSLGKGFNSVLEDIQINNSKGTIQ